MASESDGIDTALGMCVCSRAASFRAAHRVDHDTNGASRIKRRALVCGAGRFIGAHLVRRLKHEGYWFEAWI